MSGRTLFSLPGLNTHRRSYLKLLRQSCRWNNGSLAITPAGDLKFLILRSNNFSWLLHLPDPIVLADSKSRGMLLLTGESHFLRCYKLSLSFDIFCGIFESFTILLTTDHWPGLCLNKMWILLFRMKKWQIITFSYWKVTNRNFFVIKSDKSLRFQIEKWQIVTFSYCKVTNRYFFVLKSK